MEVYHVCKIKERIERQLNVLVNQDKNLGAMSHVRINIANANVRIKNVAQFNLLSGTVALLYNSTMCRCNIPTEINLEIRYVPFTIYFNWKCTFATQQWLLYYSSVVLFMYDWKLCFLLWFYVISTLPLFYERWLCCSKSPTNSSQYYCFLYVTDILSISHKCIF